MRLERADYNAKPLTYEQLTEKCRAYYAELEALTTIKVDNDSVVADRRTRLHQLIDNNLEVQAVWWPKVEGDTKPKKLYSELMEDFVAHPDLTLDQLGERHNMTGISASYKLTKEIKEGWVVQC